MILVVPKLPNFSIQIPTAIVATSRIDTKKKISLCSLFMLAKFRLSTSFMFLLPTLVEKKYFGSVLFNSRSGSLPHFSNYLYCSSVGNCFSLKNNVQMTEHLYNGLNLGMFVFCDINQEQQS